MIAELQNKIKNNLDVKIQAVADAFLDDRGRNAIYYHILDNYDKTLINELSDISFWEWSTSEGTFVKRLVRHMRDVYSVKISSDSAGKIGSIWDAYSDRGKTYTFDFTGEFNWRAGDFGDSGSCFWGGRRGAREIMRESDCYAIRFFGGDEKSGYYGISRAWLSMNENGVIVFNGYGYSTLKIARILAKYLDASYKAVRLSNNRRTDGTVYINSSSGYVIHPVENDLSSITAIDLRLKERVYCYHCGRRFWNREMSEFNGNQFCSTCYAEQIATCSDCGELFIRSNGLTDINGNLICRTCWNKLYTYCSGCGEIMLQSTNELCDSCIKRYNECEKCGRLFHPYLHQHNKLCCACQRIIVMHPVFINTSNIEVEGIRA